MLNEPCMWKLKLLRRIMGNNGWDGDIHAKMFSIGVCSWKGDGKMTTMRRSCRMYLLMEDKGAGVLEEEEERWFGHSNEEQEGYLSYFQTLGYISYWTKNKPLLENTEKCETVMRCPGLWWNKGMKINNQTWLQFCIYWRYQPHVGKPQFFLCVLHLILGCSNRSS